MTSVSVDDLWTVGTIFADVLDDLLDEIPDTAEEV